MISSTEYKRLYWHSRRGMLELDLLLIPFVAKILPQLSSEEQGLYVELLKEQDQDLFSWLVGKNQPLNPDHQRIVNIILDRVSTTT